MWHIKVGRVGQTDKKEDWIYVRCDRKTILGNPFYMKDESQRDMVCDKYRKYLIGELRKPDSEVRKEMLNLFNLYQGSSNLFLQCHCAPKRCHCDTIKEFLESKLQQMYKMY